MVNNRLVGLALLVGFGCGREPATPPGYQGVLELTETTLAFETAGRITRLDVHAGDRVARGDRIGELDDGLVRAARSARVLEAEAAHSQVELVAAKARPEELAALSARVRGARAKEDAIAKNLARQRALLERNVVPPASVDDLESELARARAERESIEAELSVLRRGARSEERQTAVARAAAVEATLELEDDRLLRHRLNSPLDGRVLERYVELGEVVGSGAPIVSIGDTRRPYAEVFVPQAELSGIFVGSAAALRVDGEPRAFPGKVEHVAQKTEFTPRYLFSERERPNLVVRVRVRIDDANERLHAGVPAFVEIRRSPEPARK